MKRSEMVTYLHNLLQTYPGGAAFESAQVDEILEGLENMGMKPPKAKVEQPRTWRLSVPGEIAVFRDWTYRYIWEDEEVI